MSDSAPNSWDSSDVQTVVLSLTEEPTYQQDSTEPSNYSYSMDVSEIPFGTYYWARSF